MTETDAFEVMVILKVASLRQISSCWWCVYFRKLQNSRKLFTSVVHRVSLIVVDAPRNLEIFPIQSIYHLGDRIQCSAEGNPAPSYQWTDLVSENVIRGSVLVISLDMVDKHHTFRCTARNSVSSNSMSLNFTVEGLNALLSRSKSSLSVASNEPS